MSLTVGRLHTRLHTPVPLAAADCDNWHAALAAQDGDTMGAGLVRDDEWLFIRHLHIATRWRADLADSDVGRVWGQALRQAIERAISAGDDVAYVRYANRRLALADMLYRSALGERRRQWAWQRMGLIARSDQSSAETLHAGVQLLVRAPELIWAVLQRIVAAEEATAAFTAILSALPPTAWQQLFAASPQTAPYARCWRDSAAETPTVVVDAADENELRRSAFAQKLLAWAAARPYLARRHGDILAVLLAASIWPGGSHREAVARRRFILARARLTDAELRAHTPATVPPMRELPVDVATPDEARRAARNGYVDEAGVADEAGNAGEAGEASTRSADRECPEFPESEQWQQTQWAGALFWLRHIAVSGALEWLDQQAEGLAVDLPLMLHAVAIVLGVPEDDVVHAVFCGGRVPEGEVPAMPMALAGQLVARWSAWLDEAAPELPEPRLETVCRRSGQLRTEPGWIELHLPLASVDTAIRRLGLDLDPGWLPWLGCVLRICYDE